MYIQRTAEDTVNKFSKQFKVILVTGARQVGKSTLLKHCDEYRNYVSLDDLTEREMAINEPKLFLENHKAPLIIDEIQYAPQLLSYIKLAVDKSDKKGQYWLTGSQQFHMMKNVSESLAGRVGIVDLMGLSLAEISGNKNSVPFDTETKTNANRKHYTTEEIFKIIYNGSYPALNNNEDIDRNSFYNSYLRTYIERDIRALTTVSDEMKFLTFIRVVAARTGQFLKYSEIAKEVDISEPTAKSWLSILVSSNLVYLLQPYYKNLNKRMTKMPKIYFLDTGLCSYLTGWSSPEVIQKGAMNGAFFETFVVSEILRSYLHNGQTPLMYVYRDTVQKEIDIIIEKNGKLYPVEIKLTANPNKSMVKNFNVLDNAGMGAIICMKDKEMLLTDDVKVIPVSDI
ncbi:MAG: ATP-binding protein [Candidatus Gastranaerophilales bacterium]|nr:ATP-binding protein [Candidatus Gastranaerophilales bacterium]